MADRRPIAVSVDRFNGCWSTTVITLFLSRKYFQTAFVVRKLVTRILFRYEKFSPADHLKKQLVLVTLPLITPSLLMKTERTLSIMRGRWIMVVPSLIMATAHTALALVGSLEPFNSRCPSILVATHDNHASSLAKYLFFIALGEAYHDPARCSFAVQT